MLENKGMGAKRKKSEPVAPLSPIRLLHQLVSSAVQTKSSTRLTVRLPTQFTFLSVNHSTVGDWIGCWRLLEIVEIDVNVIEP